VRNLDIAVVPPPVGVPEGGGVAPRLRCVLICGAAQNKLPNTIVRLANEALTDRSTRVSVNVSK
jgi:hypothetical protein